MEIWASGRKKIYIEKQNVKNKSGQTTQGWNHEIDEK